MFGFFNKTANGQSAFITAIIGLLIMIWGTFPGSQVVEKTFGSGFHFMGAVFAGLVILQLILGSFMKRPAPYVQQDAKAVDLTPWKYAKPVAAVLFVTIIAIYIALADFSALK